MESKKSRTAPSPRYIKFSLADKCDSSNGRRKAPTGSCITFGKYTITHSGEIYNNKSKRYVPAQFSELKDCFTVSIFADNGEKITKTRAGWVNFFKEQGGKHSQSLEVRGKRKRKK